MNEDVIAIILAAGNDPRMNSKKAKEVHKVCGKEIIKRVAECVVKAGVKEICVVVNENNEDDIKEVLQNTSMCVNQDIKAVLQNAVTYVKQEELNGTAGAAKAATQFLEERKHYGKVLIINGDVPLIRTETINKLVNQSMINSEAATILTAIYDTPLSYGRVVRDLDGNVKGIIEDINLEMDERKIHEINAGIYCFDIDKLLENIDEVKENPLTNKFDLPSIIRVMVEKDLRVGAMIVEDSSEALGVNDRIQLEIINKILRIRINTEHMKNGVTIEDMDTTYIYDDVQIGRDTVIHPNTTIKSNVIIGEDCEIGPNAYIRENCVLANKVKIGSFVEIKKTIVGQGSKIPHLSYVGDAEIGEKCNIGCGTITCNYDGFNKSKTIIGDRVFVGSNTNLIAPVKVEDDSFIAAGSTITDDVPKGSLAIARERQVNKEGWNK